MKYFGPAWLVFIGGFILFFAAATVFADTNGAMAIGVILLYLCAVITVCSLMIVDAIKEKDEQKEERKIKHLDF